MFSLFHKSENSSTKADKSSQCYQGGGEGVGFFDPSAMATGRGVMRSIAERAFIAYCKANDTGIAQLASGISGDDIGGCKRKGNSTG